VDESEGLEVTVPAPAARPTAFLGEFEVDIETKGVNEEVLNEVSQDDMEERGLSVRDFMLVLEELRERENLGESEGDLCDVSLEKNEREEEVD